MIALDDSRWAELYPVAGDTEEMLETLKALGQTRSDEQFARDLTYLMAMVWHDNDSCPAALAIAPHLEALSTQASLARKAACIHCIALFEVARQRALGLGIGPIVPPEIERDYVSTVCRLPERITSCLSDPWDFESAAKLAGALLVAKGHPMAGHEVMQLRAVNERKTKPIGTNGDEIPW